VRKFLIDAKTLSINNIIYFLDEIISLKELGASTLQVLTYATKFASEACDIQDKYGEIKIGKNANLGVYTENPLKNLNVLKQVKLIIKDGILISPMNFINKDSNKNSQLLKT
jgi:imidazolonepropionase-like amidohydrolase